LKHSELNLEGTSTLPKMQHRNNRIRKVSPFCLLVVSGCILCSEFTWMLLCLYEKCHF